MIRVLLFPVFQSWHLDTKDYSREHTNPVSSSYFSLSCSPWVQSLVLQRQQGHKSQQQILSSF